MFMGSGSAVHFGEQTVSAASGLGAAHAASGWWQHAPELWALLSFGWLTRSGRKLRRAEQLLEDQGRLCRELKAYLLMDLALEQLSERDFARVLCRTVATRSCFPRAALLLRTADGALAVVGSAGVDDVTVNSLNRWGGEVGPEADHGRFLLHLERRSTPPRTQGRARTMSCANMHAIPLRSASELLGVLVVSSELRPSVCGTLTTERLGRLLEPLETLCTRLSVQFARHAELAAQEPRRREHTGHRSAENAGQRRAARRRGMDRALPGGAFPRPTTTEQVASLVAATRADKTASPSSAAGEGGTVLHFSPLSRRPLPQLVASQITPGPLIA